MKLKLILLLFIGSATLLKAQNDRLEISIITCAPGAELYSVFGHSAIHVVNHDTGVDRIFDFGTFDFDTPNFAYRFIKGRLKYHLSIRDPEKFRFAYTYENRLLIEQRLDLPYAQKEQIVQRLLELYKPENRYYYYSFLEKDCSTDLRDLLEHVGVEFSREMLGKSKREQVNEYLQSRPWLKLGVNLILGRQLDVEASRFESTFLPDYLKREIDAATFQGKPLVASEMALNRVLATEEGGFMNYFSPLLILSILFLLSVFWFPKAVKVFWTSFIGLGGLLVLAIWLFSDHPEVKNNLNLLWCNPLYLLYIPLIIKNTASRLLPFILLSGLTICTISWLVGWQSFDIGIIPLLLLLAMINLKELKRAQLHGPHQTSP